MSSAPVSISIPQARRIILDAQGLSKSNPFGNSVHAVIKSIGHLGYVQLDTISVVERAHHHILWTRIPKYDHSWLDKAQYNHRKIFEYWAHAAAFLHMKDYRFSIPVMDDFRSRKDRWPKTSKADMKKVLERISAEGPLMSRDFESDHKGGSWWDWKPAKWALQRLFLEGHLMVSHREGFQRVYDLPERILPSAVQTDPPTKKEYYQYLIHTTLNAQGLATKNEISHLRITDPKVFETALNELIENRKVIRVQVRENKNYFTSPDMLEKNIRLGQKITILSPFDNLVIWRKRIKDIFDFDYTLECYIPEPKRVYGYFCLPVLFKDKFIGRIDAKADRKNKILEIRKTSWEKDTGQTNSKELYNQALKDFAKFNECIKVNYP